MTPRNFPWLLAVLPVAFFATGLAWASISEPSDARGAIGVVAEADVGRTSAATLSAAGIPTTVGRATLPARVLGVSWNDIRAVVLLRDYNTRVVMLGTTLLGLSAGTVGAFLLLRKRSLLGDVVGHAALPGVGVAFVALSVSGAGQARSLPVLLFGAAVAGVVGMLATVAIRRWTRIQEDAALAIVLSVMFGMGVVLLSVIQKLGEGGQAGIQQFIYGQTASLRADDVKVIAVGALAVAFACTLCFKEFSLLCFDERYARTQGWPVVTLDILLMALVVAVSVIGLQSVGLLLVVALLIIPAAAARFWTDRLGCMTLISGGLGAAAALLGVILSALAPQLPAGALIVLAGTSFFVVSMLFGSERGLIRRLLVQRRLRRRVGRHDLLRAMYEIVEPAFEASQDYEALPAISFDDLLGARSWPAARLRHLLRVALQENLVRLDSQGNYRLTKQGAFEAQRATRNHRLWELYLVHYADIAPALVDRDADAIEHLFEPVLWDELNRLLAAESPELVRRDI